MNLAIRSALLASASSRSDELDVDCYCIHHLRLSQDSKLQHISLFLLVPSHSRNLQTNVTLHRCSHIHPPSFTPRGALHNYMANSILHKFVVASRLTANFSRKANISFYQTTLVAKTQARPSIVASTIPSTAIPVAELWVEVEDGQAAVADGLEAAADEWPTMTADMPVSFLHTPAGTFAEDRKTMSAHWSVVSLRSYFRFARMSR